MFYIVAVALSIIVIAASNVVFIPMFTSADVMTAFLSVSVGAAVAFLIDALSALIIRRLTPERWYLPQVKLFRVSKAERNFYNKLKIKYWKDLVPELGGFTDFHKDNLKSQSDTEYLKCFIIEANYGVVIHTFNAILGFLVLFIPLCASPTIWIPVFIVNFILSILPIFILRHTSYTLLRLYQRSLNKA